MQATLAQTPATIAADGAPALPAAHTAAAGTGNAFVINLVSSTTPVALTRPDHAGLKRFTFFVSRRREDGRERFRLHMGYFDTQQEAEQLLDIVRTIYPGAWAGLAPGRRLGAAASEVPSAPGPAATPAIGTGAATPAAAADAPEPAPPAPRSLPRSDEVPSLALMPDERRRQLSDVTLDLEESPKVEPPAAGGRPAEAERPAGAGQLSGAELRAEAGRPAQLQRQAAHRSLHNVREAIASLGDDDGAVRAPVFSAIPELKPAIIPTAQPIVRQVRPAQPAAVAAAVSAAQAAVSWSQAAVAGRQAAVSKAVASQAAVSQAAEGGASLTDTATLRLLEIGSPAKRPAVAPELPASPASPTTAPAGTGAARRQAPHRAPAGSPQGPRAASHEEKPWYAVQLVWSVQPIAMTQIPQLAIFGAYTLYGAEGNRDGRRWYGLRLGFFTDAMSAKQVAHYVRADFATVSVVPVTARERDQALQAVARANNGANASGAAAPVGSASPGASGEPNAAAATSVATAVTPAGAVRGAITSTAPQARQPQFAFIEGTDPMKKGGRPGAARPSRGAPGKRAKPRPPGQIHARTRTKPKTLEETLEILGAGELQVDDGSAARLNDSGVRHLKLEAAKAKPSKLSRLIERLSERMGS